MEMDSDVERAENRRQIQQCLEKSSSASDQQQRIKIISQCLFDRAQDQIAAEQLMLSTVAHKESASNPLRHKRGPRTLEGFGFHLYPIGFAVNINAEKTHFDLIVLNWNNKVPDFFKTVFSIDDKPCYLIEDLPLGDVFSKESDSCFSYISKKRFETDTTATTQSPKIRLLWELLGKNISYHDFTIFRGSDSTSTLSTLDLAILYLHETYHVHEHNSLADQLYLSRQDDIMQMVGAIDQFLRSEEEQKLLYAYGLLVLKITQPEPGIVAVDKKQFLAMLKSLIAKIKSKNSLLWDRFIKFEYDEGMAEFFAIQTVLDNKFVDIVDVHDLELLDCNAIFYKTGALGMHLLANILENKFWPENPAIPSQGIWEKLTAMSAVEADDEKLDDFLNVLKDHERIRAEIAKMVKYFTSNLPVTATLCPLSKPISARGLLQEQKRVYLSPDKLTKIILIGNRVNALPSFRDKSNLLDIASGKIRSRECWKSDEHVEVAFVCDSIDGVSDILIENGYTLLSDEEVDRLVREKLYMVAAGEGSLDVPLRIIFGSI